MLHCSATLLTKVWWPWPGTELQLPRHWQTAPRDLLLEETRHTGLRPTTGLHTARSLLVQVVLQSCTQFKTDSPAKSETSVEPTSVACNSRQTRQHRTPLLLTVFSSPDGVAIGPDEVTCTCIGLAPDACCRGAPRGGDRGWYFSFRHGHPQPPGLQPTKVPVHPRGQSYDCSGRGNE